MTNQKIDFKMIEKNADILTPVGIFKRLEGEKKFLLESSFQHETKGNYSFIGANPFQEIIGFGNETIIANLRTGKKETVDQHTVQYLKENFPKIDCDLPLPFTGGAIGYVAYDAIRQFFDIGAEQEDELKMPDYHFMVYDTIIAYEHRKEKAHIVTVNFDGASESELEKRLNKINSQLDKQISIPDPKGSAATFRPLLSKDTFIKNVEEAKKFIAKNEAEQIVLSQRMVADLEVDPFSFYRELRTANPSPYMFYIDLGDYLIIGASPESLVQTTGNQVITNPIAGTRPRGKTAEEDAKLKQDLLIDTKELKEHEMLVELSKKDLKSTCKHDSIHVPVNKDVVKYEHVMHIVSEVHGTLQENKSSMDALVSCLPAGTVSGSPKARAMQIINDIETERRGFYAGGIGYISFNHDINLAIAIRSLVVKNNRAYLQTGAGIVADSVPEKEYLETLHKARSLTNLNGKSSKGEMSNENVS